MNRRIALFAAIALAAGLAACGGSSDFKSKFMAECQKDPQGHDCSCAADILDKELDDKTKKLLLVMSDPDVQKDPAKMEQALKDAGMSQEEMMSVATKMGPTMEKVETQCKAK